jgi:hypothetical protein
MRLQRDNGFRRRIAVAGMWGTRHIRRRSAPDGPRRAAGCQQICALLPSGGSSPMRSKVAGRARSGSAICVRSVVSPAVSPRRSDGILEFACWCGHPRCRSHADRTRVPAPQSSFRCPDAFRSPRCAQAPDRFLCGSQRRRMLNDMRRHLAHFLERRLLCLCQIRKLYHTSAN